MMAGMLLAVLLYRPVYKMMYDLADVKQQQEQVERKTISRTRSTNEQGASVVSSKTTHFFPNGNSVVESSTQIGDAAPSIKKEVQLGDYNYWMMVLLVLLQVILVTMVYGPIAAFLVELFPTKIRYTSMSLPYHIGNGVFGGLTPFLATALYEASKTEANPAGDPFAGLWYPIAIAGASFLIGMVLLSNKKAEEVMD